MLEVLGGVALGWTLFEVRTDVESLDSLSPRVTSRPPGAVLHMSVHGTVQRE